MPGTANRSGRRVTRDDPTRQDGPPARPPWLSAGALEQWTYLLDQLEPRMLRRIDQHLIGGLCELLSQAACLPEKIAAAEDEKIELSLRRLLIQTNSQIGRMSILFGLSPRDRAGLNLEQEDAPDDVEEWLRSS